MRYIPEDNLKYPVLIELGNGQSASGFYLNKNNESYYLVTARHVLYQEDQGGNFNLLSNNIKLTSYSNEPGGQRLEISVKLKKLQKKTSKEHDVVVVKIGKLKKITETQREIKFEDGVKPIALKSSGRLISVRTDSLKKYDDVLVSNEVFIFGYPNSLSFNNAPQIDYKSPLLRRGIVAGKNADKKTIILDCPAYPGNSGGLVIEVEKTAFNQTQFKIIGVVSEFIPFVDQLKSLRLGYINTTMENSGYSVVIPTDTILELIKGDDDSS